MDRESTIVVLNLISLMIRMTPIFVCLRPRHAKHENIAAISVYIWTLMISAQSLFQIPEDEFTFFQAVFSALFFLILLVFFEGSLMLKAFFYFSAWFFAEILTSLNSFFAYVLREQSEQSYENISVLLAVSMLILFYVIVRYHFKERILRLFDQLSTRGTALVILMPVFFLILLYLGRQTVFSDESLLSGGLPILAFYLALYVFMLVFYFLTINDILLTIDQRTTEEQLTAAREIVSLKRKNYKQLMDYQKQIRIIKHDFSHHLHALEHMSDDERAAYVGKLRSELDQSEKFVFCDNAAVNSLLQEYKTRAKDDGIDFQTEISIEKDLPVDSLSICVILGNLLENAIEACAKCDKNSERFIILQMRDEAEGLRIMVKNSFNGKIRTYRSRLLTTKKSGGLGVLSIKRLLDNPRDDFDYYYDEDIFVAMVYLKHRN